MRPRAVLITDLDNTLFSWIDYFAPSLRAMVDVITRETSVARSEIYRQLRDVYRKYRAAEHPYVIPELELCRRMKPRVRTELARRGEAAFDRARRRHLKAYPHVSATLSRLRQHNVLVAGVTSSSVYDAVTRIEMLGLDAAFAAVVAWEGISGISTKGSTGLIERVIPVSAGRLKPSSHPYLLALKSCRVGRQTPVWVVGDSITNDLVPARDIGAKTVWARYGLDYQPDNFETVLQVTFWDDAKVKASYDPTALVPDNTIDCFSEMSRLILGQDVASVTSELAERHSIHA